MKKRRSLVAALLAVIMLVCTFALPLPVTAADVGGPYTVVVRYTDTIYIEYKVVYPGNVSWSGPADIPIGGTEASSQIYCADPFVHFHKHGDVVWDVDRLTDTVTGYVAAAPWTVSGAMRQNEEAVRWLVLNGYRGNFTTPDAISQKSVARLQGMYPDITPIDKTVALMATKIAIWKVVAGDGVEYTGTSLDDDRQGRDKALESLIAALVADATTGGHGGHPNIPYTEMRLEIITTDVESEMSFDDTSMYYGPLRVTATIENPSYPVDVNLAGVLIDVGGENADGITVTSATTSTELIPSPVFGTDEDAFPLKLDEGKSIGDNQWESGNFYLRIPNSRKNADELTIHARAKATDVPLLEGTPITYVYVKDGKQDWDELQGFTGGSDDGVKADLYAEKTWSTGTTPRGQIWVSKQVKNDAYGDREHEYTFKLLYSEDQEFQDPADVNLSHYNVYGAVSVDKTANTFTLKADGLAYIDELPTDRYYQFVESNLDGDQIAASVISVGNEPVSSNGAQSSVFSMDDGLAMVEFTNTYLIPKINFYIGKAALKYLRDQQYNYTDTGPYYFRFEKSVDGGNWEPVDMLGVAMYYGIDPESGTADGTFQLSSTQMVSFSLPVSPGHQMQYRVAEAKGDSKLVPGYEAMIIRSSGEGNPEVPPSAMEDIGTHYATSPISFDADGGTCYIAFSNVDYNLQNLTLTKTVSGGSVGSSETQFPFTLTYTGIVEGSPVSEKIPLSAENPNSGFIVLGDNFTMTSDRIKNDADDNPTILLLKAGETAQIMGLPPGSYEVSEGTVTGYTTTYKVEANGVVTSGSSSTAPVDLTEDTTLTFTNTVRPDTPYSPPSSPSTSSPPVPGPSPVRTPSPSTSPSPSSSPDTTPRPSASPTNEEPDGPGDAPARTPRVSPARTPRVSPDRTPRIPSTTVPAPSATPTPTVGPDGRDIGDDGPGTGVPDISPAPGVPDTETTPDNAMPKTGDTRGRPEHAIPIVTGAVCLVLAALYGRSAAGGWRKAKKRRG